MERTGRITTACAAAFLLLAAGAAFAAEPGRKQVLEASKLCREGGKLLEKGQVDEASERFEKALAVVPGFADAHVGLGHVAMQRQSYESAVRHFESAIADFRAAGERRQKRDLERWRDARTENDGLEADIASVNSPHAKSSSSAQAAATRSREDKVRRNEMVTGTDRVTDDVPADVWFHLGTAQFRLGRLEEAQVSWENSARGRPDFGPVHNNLAFAYWKAGRLDDARREITLAEKYGATVNPEFKKQLQ